MRSREFLAPAFLFLLVLTAPDQLLAQKDEHAGHAHESAAPSPTRATAPLNEAIPPDAEAAKSSLEKSPRHGEWVDVKLPGGGALQTWVVYPEKKSKAGAVIVIHEIYGLTDWVRGVADQLAEDGFIALAPDLLSGMGPGGGGTGSLGSEVGKVIRTLGSETVVQRLDAVREYALKLPAASGKLGVVGYCWGGSASFSYAASQPRLDAAVVYYGSSPSDPASYAKISAPVLGLYGADDARVNATIPTAEAEMKKLGKSFTVKVFAGAGHGFLRQQSGREGANRRASEEAWAATLTFFRQHLEGGPVLGSATLDVKAVADSSATAFRVPRGFILQAAEKMPEEHYSFRPTPDVRSFGEVVAHIADGYRVVCSLALGEKPPADMKAIENAKKTKAELVKALRETAEECDRAHIDLSGEKGAELMSWYGGKQPRVTVLFFGSAHAWEHYGNLATYMRLKGIVPPSSEPRKPVHAH